MAMTMTGSRTVERRETASLIGSDKVDGTAVYGADEQRIGSIQRVMIDKISGKVAYAVISGSVVDTELRHKSRGLPRKLYQRATSKRAEVQPEHRLELEQGK